MYRRYYSYNDMPHMVQKNDCKPEKKEEKCDNKPYKDEKKLFGRLEIDDVILAVVIFAILLDDGDDNILLIALAVLLLSGSM